MAEHSAKKLRNILFWVGVFVSGGSIIFVLESAGLQQTGRALAGVDLKFAFLCLVFTIVHMLVRNRRWQVTISQTVGYLNCLWAQGIGFLFTMFLPLRLGDAVRIVVLHELEKPPFWAVAASVLLERIIDVAVTLALFLCLIPLLDFAPEIRFAALVLAAALSVMCAAVLFGSYLGQRLAPGRIRNLIGPVIEQIRDAMKHVARSHVAGQVFSWTALGWGVGVFRHWLALMAFVPDATVLESLMLTIMLSLAIALPSAPGFIGVFQVVGQQALVLPFAGKYDPATALGVTVVLHLALFLTSIVLGLAGIGAFGRHVATKGVILLVKERALSYIDSGKDKPPPPS